MPTSQCTTGQLPTPVSIGGTGNTSFTSYVPITAGTTSTGAFQSLDTQDFPQTSGYHLDSIGSGQPFWDTPTGNCWILIKTLNASNSSSIEFKSLISASYSNYYLVWSQASPSTNPGALRFYVSTNNGSSYITTNYQSGQFTVAYNSSTFSNNNQTSSGIFTLQIQTSDSCSGLCLLQNVTNGAKFQYNGRSTYTSNGVTQFGLFSGTNTATSVNAIKLTFDSGNINTGTFSLYGVSS